MVAVSLKNLDKEIPVQHVNNDGLAPLALELESSFYFLIKKWEMMHGDAPK